MRGVLRAIDATSQFVGLSVAHFYLICALITAYEVLMRYIFNAPTEWAFEVVMVVCATAWVLSGAYVARREAHIAITIVHQMTSGRARWWLDLFIYVVTLVALLALCYAVWDPMVQALQQFERSGSSFNAPEPVILKTMLFVGALLYALQVAANLARHLAGSGGVPRPDAVE